MPPPHTPGSVGAPSYKENTAAARRDALNPKPFRAFLAFGVGLRPSPDIGSPKPGIIQPVPVQYKHLLGSLKGSIGVIMIMTTVLVLTILFKVAIMIMVVVMVRSVLLMVIIMIVVMMRSILLAAILINMMIVMVRTVLAVLVWALEYHTLILFS